MLLQSRNVFRAVAATLTLALLAPASSHLAAASQVHTVEDGDSIQDAIDDADAGDVILVEPGVYDEDLTVNKADLTLVGPNAGIHGADTANRGPEAVIEGKFLRMRGPADGFTLDGFWIQTSGRAIYADNIATIQNNVLIGEQPATESFQSGVFSGTTRALVVERNYIEGFDRGVTLDGGPGSLPSIIEDNVITGVGTGISTQGSLFESVGHEIVGNLIEGNSGTGIRIAGRRDTSTVTGPTFTIELNDILDNNVGIGAGFPPTHSAAELVVTDNNIEGNGTGLRNFHADELVATCNWWGSIDGPSGDGPGSGDSVDGNVVFTPWLIDAAPFGACVGGSLDELIADIQDANVHLERQLTNALESALHHITEGRFAQACDALDRFIRHADRQVSQKNGITEAQRDDWVGQVEDVQDELGCN